MAETLHPPVEWTGRTLRLIQALERRELARGQKKDSEQDADNG